MGPQHQAGSDSLLTLCCYFKMLDQNEIFGPRQFKTVKYHFGIGISYMKKYDWKLSTREYMENYVDRNEYGYDTRNPCIICIINIIWELITQELDHYNYLQGQCTISYDVPTPLTEKKILDTENQKL